MQMYFRPIAKTSVFPHHKLDGVQETLVELRVLEVVLWTVCTVQHPTRITRSGTKLLLACIL